ncbi:MAG: glutamate 5-kinase, partial [Planktotalea sp.]
MASLKHSKRVVLKIGSALLVEKGRLRQEWLTALAEDVAM